MYKYSIVTADYGMVANREAWVMTELRYRRFPGRMWFVPNGADPRFFLNRDYTRQVARRLLFVGTWLDRKGVLYLVDALTIVARNIPEITLTVAGCILSSQRILSYFPGELRRRVCVKPFLPRESMPALYSSHDIFVFPSLVEGMPLTLLEAMATGMPVVTTNTSGMADVVQNGVNGLLVTPADACGLAAAIDRLCNSEQLRKDLGRAAQETMRRQTWRHVTKEFENILCLAAESKKI